MDLKEFYFENIQESEYHYRFHDSIKNVNRIHNIFSGYKEVDDYEFEVYDTEEAITKFKELCQPDVDFYHSEKKLYFILNLCAKFSLKSQPSIYGKYGKWIL